MAMTEMSRKGPLHDLRAADERQYRLLYAATFAIFLLVALIIRLLPRTWDPLEREPGARRSILGDARTAASTTVGYAFMR